MFKNKVGQRNNLCGVKIFQLRVSKEFNLSQRQLADKLQVAGLDLDKNAVQRIESGQRFVTDIELKTLAHFFSVSADFLLSE